MHSNKMFPADDFPAGVKSIKNSPNATTSNIYMLTLLYNFQSTEAALLYLKPDLLHLILGLNFYLLKIILL